MRVQGRWSTGMPLGRVGKVLATATCVACGALSTSSASQAACPNEALRTGASGRLPDCRAYELVTPAEKGGSEDLKHSAVVGEDGERVALYTVPRLEPNPQVNGSFLIFDRGGGSGWRATSVTPPEADQEFARQPIFTGDLSNVAFGLLTQLGQEFSPTQTFWMGPAGGPYTSIATLPIAGTTEEEEQKSRTLNLFGASPDFSHVVLASTDHELLGPDTGTDPGAFDLYEYHAGSLTRVNVTTGGGLVNPCGAVLGYGEGIENSSTHHAVSSSGSKIFFSSPDPHPVTSGEAGCEEPTQIYMRVDDSETVEISAPEGGVTPPELDPAIYAGASTDGKDVLFTTRSALTSDDAGHSDNELYLYDTDARTLTRVSHGETGTAAGEVIAGLGGPEYGAVISDDGSSVYFVAGGQLTSDAPSSGLKLYRYQVGTDQTRYIATLAANSNGRFPLFATPDGGFVAFTSSEVVGGGFSTEGHQEVYRYDATADELSCVSCPEGPAVASASLPLVEGATGVLLETPDITPWPHPISDDGRFVFFNSKEPLVPEDTNTAPTEIGEAYEWEEEGTGGCSSAQGCQRLLSSGNESTSGSALLGASDDGSSAFFLTHSPLVPQDKDQVDDIYDVRIGGGFPAPAKVADCGEECQGQPSPPPILSSPATIAQNAGPGGKARTTRRRSRTRALNKCKRLANGQRRRVCKRRVQERFNKGVGR